MRTDSRPAHENTNLGNARTRFLALDVLDQHNTVVCGYRLGCHGDSRIRYQVPSYRHGLFLLIGLDGTGSLRHNAVLVESVRNVTRFLALLFRQWWFAALTVLSAISTVSTFIPAFYGRFAVPRWVPLLGFIVAFFIASFRVYRTEQSARIQDQRTADDRIAQLEQQLATRPYDEEKRAAAEQSLARYSVRHRDLIRFLLVHENPTAQIVRAASRLNDQESLEVIRLLERDDVIRRTEDHLSGITRFFVSPNWVDVYRDLLFPRDEQENPQYYT